MLKVKQKLVNVQHSEAYQRLAMVDAFTDIKAGRLVSQITRKAFGNYTGRMPWSGGWDTKNSIVKHAFYNSLGDLRNNIYHISIPTEHFLSRAILVADTAYLKLCNESAHNFKEEECFEWQLNYIRENLLEVSKTVLMSFAALYIDNACPKILAVEEGTFKSHFCDTIYTYICLKMQLYSDKPSTK